MMSWVYRYTFRKQCFKLVLIKKKDQKVFQPHSCAIDILEITEILQSPQQWWRAGLNLGKSV